MHNMLHDKYNLNINWRLDQYQTSLYLLVGITLAKFILIPFHHENCKLWIVGIVMAHVFEKDFGINTLLVSCFRVKLSINEPKTMSNYVQNFIFQYMLMLCHFNGIFNHGKLCFMTNLSMLKNLN